MPDDLADDEVQELLRERRVEVGVVREFAQARDLAGLTVGIGRWQVVVGFQPADTFGALEALGEEVYEGGIDIVDARANLLELSEGVVGLRHVEESTGRATEPISVSPRGMGMILCCCPATRRLSSVGRASHS